MLKTFPNGKEYDVDDNGSINADIWVPKKDYEKYFMDVQTTEAQEFYSNLLTGSPKVCGIVVGQLGDDSPDGNMFNAKSVRVRISGNVNDVLNTADGKKR